MRITIAQRFLPFSHESGTMCMLPGTALRLQIFPALFRVENLNKPIPVEEFAIPIKGPVKDYTVLQNLEKGRVEVWGNAASGFFRYFIFPAGECSFTLQVDKGNFQLALPSIPLAFSRTVNERLSLGISKKLDWQLVARRCDMEEILPLWLFLGQMTPAVDVGYEGTGFFLKECEVALQENRADEALQNLRNLFLTGFEGILSPRLRDDFYQGFNLPSINEERALSPLALLSHGALLIRRLFIQQTEDEISILPHLPHLLHAGRFAHVKCDELGRLDMEWRSRKLRRLIFYSQASHSIKWRFPKGISGCRLRLHENESGKQLLNGDSVDIAVNDRLLFDHFE